MSPHGDAAPQALRQAWLALLARASTAELELALQRCAPRLRSEFLRRPECALVMLRGRVGGSGAPFNLGEATITRCALRLADGQVGVGHVLGRDKRKAELVALFDALLQEPAYRERLQPDLLAPLRQRQQDARTAVAQAAGASQVEFFTMVRPA